MDTFRYSVLEPPIDHAAIAAERAREAADLVARARAEAEEIRAAAYAEGLARGREEALAALDPAVDAFAAAARALDVELVAALAEVEPAAIDLAMKVAEQALGAALAVEPERVLDAVRGALRRLLERERVLLLVNPEDLDLVRARVDALTGELGGIEHCEVQAERRVARGGAIVRTEEGEVDATLATKLARAREVLEHELAGG